MGGLVFGSIPMSNWNPRWLKSALSADIGLVECDVRSDGLLGTGGDDWEVGEGRESWSISLDLKLWVSFGLVVLTGMVEG